MGKSMEVPKKTENKATICCCCSVTQSCPTHCNPTDYSTTASLSYTIFRSLLKFMSIESVMLSIWCSAAAFSFCLQSFPASGSFPMSQLFASDDQSTGASATASVLPMNIQSWFPLELTGFISLLSKGLSRVFSKTRIGKHQLFGTPASIHDYWENHSFN